MAFGFIRLYKVTVLSPPKDGAIVKAVIMEHQFSGSFQHNNTGTNASPDNASIVITNPDTKTLAALREKGAKIEVAAGYRYVGGIEYKHSDLSVIYRGEVTKTSLTRTSSDTKIKVDMSQGYSEWSGATISETFEPGEFLTDLLDSIVLTTELGSVVTLGTRSSETIPTHKTLNGSSPEILERLCRQYRLKWYMENETVYVVPILEKFEAKSHEPVIRDLAQRIKGTASWSVDEAGESGGETAMQVDVNLFLSPDIGIGNSVVMMLDDSEILLTIESITHTLDYFGDAWETNIVAKGKQLSAARDEHSKVLQDYNNIA